MGRNIAGATGPLPHPRTVRDTAGRVLGLYFPASERVRLAGGELVAVERDGNIRLGDGQHAFLDRVQLVLDIGDGNGH
jgi:hypothetical protein